MKKQYISPLTEIQQVKIESMMTGSPQGRTGSASTGFNGEAADGEDGDAKFREDEEFEELSELELKNAWETGLW